MWHTCTHTHTHTCTHTHIHTHTHVHTHTHKTSFSHNCSISETIFVFLPHLTQTAGRGGGWGGGCIWSSASWSQVSLKKLFGFITAVKFSYSEVRYPGERRRGGGCVSLSLCSFVSRPVTSSPRPLWLRSRWPSEGPEGLKVVRRRRRRRESRWIIICERESVCACVCVCVCVCVRALFNSVYVSTFWRLLAEESKRSQVQIPAPQTSNQQLPSSAPRVPEVHVLSTWCTFKDYFINVLLHYVYQRWHCAIDETIRQ